jgi:hypothetical protein
MKLPSCWFYKVSHLESFELGLECILCREAPFVTILKPDQSYYDYLNVKIKLVKYWLCFDIYYRRLPYENLQQFRAFKKSTLKT